MHFFGHCSSSSVCVCVCVCVCVFKGCARARVCPHAPLVYVHISMFMCMLGVFNRRNWDHVSNLNIVLPLLCVRVRTHRCLCVCLWTRVLADVCMSIRVCVHADGCVYANANVHAFERMNACARMIACTRMIACVCVCARARWLIWHSVLYFSLKAWVMQVSAQHNMLAIF